jgi:hypothetical protein
MKYPESKFPEKVGTYLALTQSGGGTFYDCVLEYRVWCHPTEGDDCFYTSSTYEEALEIMQRKRKSHDFVFVEDPLVLIQQNEWVSFENGKYIRKKGIRLTEWEVEWLENSKREKDSIKNFIKKENNENKHQ